MRRYLYPMLLILVSTGVYLYYVQDTYTGIRMSMQQEAALDASLSKVDEAQAKQQELQGEYAAFPPGSDHSLKTLMPETIDPNKFIIDMDEFVREQGLVMKGPSVGVLTSVIGGEPVVIHTFKFSVTAPYAAFRTFLRAVEQSLALRDIGNITFSSSVSNNVPLSGQTLRAEDIPHDYQVSISSYSLK